ncbi:MAG TPA: endo-1,4-D-glucanase, partial [Sutterella sp.]|nr:endo-1,4-D-glucanase [Sutterella sp.]
MQFSRRTLLGAAVAAGISGPALAFFNYRFRWAEFCEANLDASGRVIDASDKRMITTSEGQSYAL